LIFVFTVTIKKIYAVNRVNMLKRASYQRQNRECCAIAVKKEGKTLYPYSKGYLPIRPVQYIDAKQRYFL
jgi:hypothetical protein